MKVNGGKLFPYPVYSEEKNDYQTGLGLDADLEYGGDVAVLKLKVSCEDKAIQNLIINDDAGMYCLVECSSTKYRELFSIDYIPDKEDYELQLALDRLNGTVEIVLLLVAKKEIINFSSGSLTELYQDESFHFAKYSTIGYSSTTELVVTKKIDINGDVPSIFAITKSDAEHEMTYDYSGNQIAVFLPAREYSSYFALKGTYQRVKQMMLVLPVLVDVFNLIFDDPDNGLEDRPWYAVLDLALRKHGYEDGLSDDRAKSENRLVLAQHILGSVVHDALSELEAIGD